MALSKSTKDHDEIRKWAEARGAVPSEVSSTHTGDEVGILRFQFPQAKNKNDTALQEISWDDFFEKFDESDLTLVYQDKTASGQNSNFNKLVHPENAKVSGPTKKKSVSSAGKQIASHSKHRKGA